jgi:hypothetical protein
MSIIVENNAEESNMSMYAYFIISLAYFWYPVNMVWMVLKFPSGGNYWADDKGDWETQRKMAAV